MSMWTVDYCESSIAEEIMDLDKDLSTQSQISAHRLCQYLNDELVNLHGRALGLTNGDLLSLTVSLDLLFLLLLLLGPSRS